MRILVRGVEMNCTNYVSLGREIDGTAYYAVDHKWKLPSQLLCYW